MKTENIKIRKASKKDFSKIVPIWIKEFARKPYNEKWSKKDTIRKIKDYSKNSKVNVIELNKKIIGSIIIKEEIWDKGPQLSIKEFVIKKEYQGKGAGTFVIRRLEEEYQGRIKAFSLWTFKKGNAFKFYKKLKFKEVNGLVCMYKKSK